MAQAINYVLLKYSRSYSPDDPGRLSHQPTISDSEWQHFANPKLQLLLDGSHGGSYRSANVKIMWVPAGGRLQDVQQEAIAVLEDIDLSSFSHLSNVSQKTRGQSPPLKVVYRDSVVGFRYLHPRVTPPETLPTFRRFQICFPDPLLATQFVNNIRHICPCKASPPTALRTTAAAAHAVVASSTSLTPTNKAQASTESLLLASQHAARTLQLSTSALVNDLPNHNMQSPMLPINDQTIQNNVDTSGLPLCGTQTSPLGKVAVAPSHINHLLQTSQATGQPLSSPTVFAASSPQIPCKGKEQANPDLTFHARKSYTAALSVGCSDPSSRSGNSTQRYVTSSIDTAIDAPSTSPNLTYPKDVTHNCNSNEKLGPSSQAVAPLDCLRDLCCIKELCAMSMEQLEQLVGEVIREPEFPTLLEKLDTMWEVKAIITRASKEYRY